MHACFLNFVGYKLDDIANITGLQAETEALHNLLNSSRVFLMLAKQESLRSIASTVYFSSKRNAPH